MINLLCHLFAVKIKIFRVKLYIYEIKLLSLHRFRCTEVNPKVGRVVSVSTMTYCVVQINCLPLPRFLKKVTMKTAEERYEETWNSYLELLNKDPRASLVSFTKLKSVYYRGMTKWMSHNGLSVYDAKAKIRECHRKSLSGEPVSCNTTSMFLPVTADETASGNPMADADLLSGVSLTFPDGTIVNIKRGSAKALVSFLSLYRKGGEPCLG